MFKFNIRFRIYIKQIYQNVLISVLHVFLKNRKYFLAIVKELARKGAGLEKAKAEVRASAQKRRELEEGASGGSICSGERICRNSSV